MAVYNVTLAKYNSTSAPTAGTTLASLSPAIGWHQVFCWAYFASGTLGSADVDNVGVYVDGNLYTTMIQPSALNVGLPPLQLVVQTTTGSIALKAISSSNGTTVVYKTALTTMQVPQSIFR